MLKATGVSNFMANAMGSAVYLNIGWVAKTVKPMPDIDRLFKDILIT